MCYLDCRPFSLHSLFLPTLLGERNTCDVAAQAQQSLLQHNVARLRIGASLCAMMEIAAADLSSGLVAYREPRLCFVSLLQIIRRTRPTHFCRNPTGIDCVRVHI